MMKPTREEGEVVDAASTMGRARTSRSNFPSSVSRVRGIRYEESMKHGRLGEA